MIGTSWGVKSGRRDLTWSFFPVGLRSNGEVPVSSWASRELEESEVWMSAASERRASPKVSCPSTETKRMRRVQVMLGGLDGK